MGVLISVGYDGPAHSDNAQIRLSQFDVSKFTFALGESQHFLSVSGALTLEGS